MSKRITVLMFIALFAIATSTFALAQNGKADAAKDRQYDVKMMGFTICIVDYESNKAHLYKESKDDKALKLFKSIDMSKAGDDTIEYVEPIDDPVDDEVKE